MRLKWGLEKSFGIPYQKSADTLKFVFTQVSHISQQKKVNTISHMRQTEGLTSCRAFSFFESFYYSSLMHFTFSKGLSPKPYA